MKKRILTILLSLVVTLSMISVPSFATSGGDGAVTAKASETSVKVGDTFTVSVDLKNISGKPYGGIGFKLHLSDGLEYVSSAIGSLDAYKIKEFSDINNSFSAAMSDTDETKDLHLVTFTLKAKNSNIGANTVSFSDFTVGDQFGVCERNYGTIDAVTINTYAEISGEQLVEISAPVKGETPQSTIKAATGYTGKISWIGDPDVFAKETAYSANVVLKAKRGYMFATDATAKVASADSITDTTVDTDGSTLSFTANFPQTSGNAALVGTVAISGTPAYGETLSANTGALQYNGEEPGTLSYQWNRGGASIDGATNSTYKLVEADINKTITVTVKNSNNSGSVTSEPTAAVAKATCAAIVTKADVEKTVTIIRVKNVISGQEYAIVANGAGEPAKGWNTTGQFSGLTANTEYDVYTRVAATNTHLASVAVKTDVTTDKLTQTIEVTNPTPSVSFGKTLDINTLCESNAEGATLVYSMSGNGLPADASFNPVTGVLTAGNTTGSCIIKVNSAAVGSYNQATEQTITVSIVEKPQQAALNITSGLTATYGTSLTLSCSGGSGTGAVIYEIINGGEGGAKIEGTTFTPVTAGAVKVQATKAGDADYSIQKSNIVTINIAKAKPTGNPDFTTITTTGKTLSDAAIKIGTLAPAGKVAWIDSADTKVIANAEYKWLFTPNDTVNYTTLGGVKKLYTVGGSSNSGGGGGGGSTTTTTKTTAPAITVQEQPVPLVDVLPFTDVSKDYWAYASILECYTKGYFAGKTATIFDPNSSMTREQMWMVLARVSGEKPANMEEAKQWAVAKGISDGTDSKGNVTREQFVTQIWRMEGSPASTKDLSGFADINTVSGYAKTAMAWAVEKGLISGTTDITISPEASATRAQIATIIARYTKNM